MAKRGLSASQSIGGANYKGMSKPLPALTLPSVSSAVAPQALSAYNYNDYNKGAHTGYQSSAPSVGNMSPNGVAFDANAGGLGNYATIPNGSGGQLGISQDAYNAIQNPTQSGADGGSWLANNKDNIALGAQGLQAASGLANAYMGYKNYGLAKDMFGFEKAATNRNIANQAQLVNNEIQNAGEVGMSLAGNTMDPNARAARQAQLNTMKVSGSPVG